MSYSETFEEVRRPKNQLLPQLPIKSFDFRRHSTRRSCIIKYNFLAVVRQVFDSFFRQTDLKNKPNLDILTIVFVMWFPYVNLHNA